MKEHKVRYVGGSGTACLRLKSWKADLQLNGRPLLALEPSSLKVGKSAKPVIRDAA